MWPNVVGAQAVAVECLRLWQHIVSQGNVGEVHRRTWCWCHPDVGVRFHDHIKTLAAEGRCLPELDIEIGDTNCVATCEQSVESRHASVAGMSARRGRRWADAGINATLRWNAHLWVITQDGRARAFVLLCVVFVILLVGCCRQSIHTIS